MSIGDVNSDARGSGARYNDGKPPVDLIPLSTIAASFNGVFGERTHTLLRDAVQRSLDMLGGFQETGDATYLACAIDEVRFAWRDCARVFGYGKKKYAPWNWAKGMSWSIPLGCAGRHALCIFEGQLVDDESRLPHIGHYLANLVMLDHYVDNYPEGNDLPDPKLFEGSNAELQDHPIIMLDDVLAGKPIC